MNKKQFQDLVIPLNEKEQLYRIAPERSEHIYQNSRYIKQGDFYTVYFFEFDQSHSPQSAPTKITVNTAGDGHIIFNKQNRFSRVPLHRHDCIEMNYVYRGHCTSLINGHTVEMQQGDVSILDSGVVHTVLPTGENDILLNCLMDQRYFTAGFIERIAASGPIPRFLSNALIENRDHDHYLLFHTADSPLFCDLMEGVFCEYLDPGPCSDGAISSYMSLIFIELVRSYQGKMESEYRHNRRLYITEILRYMDENCVTCTLEDTAEHFGFHPNYLSRMIRQATGSNFKDLIADGRLSRAAFLLRSTADPISKIAQSCGYQNQNFFYKKFKTRYGCTPAEYREGRM